MSKKLIVITVLLLTILGGIFRFWNFTKNPPHLNIDEVAWGYNAYSILKTARDEFGSFMPISFKSTGDYKSPLPVYLLVPSVAVFGLNEFAVRFPHAFLAVLSIPFYFLFFRKITKNEKVALAATLLLTVSPWHIYFSRYLYEPILAIFLVSMGVYCFLKMLEGKWWWGIFAAIFFVLPIYTYAAFRLFVPLLVLSLLFIYKKAVLEKKRAVATCLIIIFLLALPFAIRTFWGPDAARANMVILSKDIDYTRYVRLYGSEFVSGFFAQVTQPFLLFFFWVKRYLNYFQPSFLFFNGLNMTTAGSYGLGIMNVFEIPFLLFGVWAFFKNKLENKPLIASWILLGLFPASLANNEQSSGRSLTILPVLLLLSAIGAIEFFRWINSKKKLYKKIIVTIFLLFVGWNLFREFLVFSRHFPNQRDEAFMNGTKEALLYAIANQDKYEEIIFDPYRGIEAPYIVSVPHTYYLFYSGYDPAKYQSVSKTIADEYFHFDKFTVRRTDWRTDRYKKDVLFIGSPWSFPAGDLKDTIVLKNIYLNNRALALMVVTHK